MSDRNAFSAGLGAKIVGAFSDYGGTPNDANHFAESEKLVRGMIDAVRGKVKVEFVKIERSEIIIPELGSDFIPRHFYQGVDVSRETLVKISFLGEHFRKSLLPLVVKPRKSFFLSSRIMSPEDHFHENLDQMKKADLSAIWYLLSQQPEGPDSKEGAMLTNGSSNVFCCEDLSQELWGQLWEVCIRWNDNGWHIEAHKTTPSYVWLGKTVLVFL